ncbi:patatin-like phospholipase family protein [Nocardia sp. 2]|uniref:Patatin-like phospholipase family protein n=1 Tax=Nocardia acididurans TaxID=2802282 RepID=A0ABS1M2P7_9NOCA|nr:patatin-like phospholipase family protein [Nocardia acididurans]MBL1074943.1 patatin-like phospholipase family protein [Nocardia acididurans]
MIANTALVLGGGGVAGIAWQTGIVAGLAAAGIDVNDAEVVIGTSAGATVAAQLSSGLPVTELYARQADPARQYPEMVPPGISFADLWPVLAEIYTSGADPAEQRKRVCALAREAETVPQATRYAIIEGRLPVHTWPERALRITAVDVDSGIPRIFDRTSEVPLVTAVAASCAVPGIWPPVTIGEARYTDGGVRTSVNADLASGYDRVLILAILVDPFLDDQIAELRSTGSRVELITPDEASLAAFGTDPLDPTSRTPAAEAGRAQADSVAPALLDLFA